jgi:hypothetical protein
VHNSDFRPSEPIASVSTSVLNGNGLVVVGGPSDAWEMSRQSIRMCAPDYGTRRGRFFEPGRCCHRGPGYGMAGRSRPIRNQTRCFRHRTNGPGALTGGAARTINRALAIHGITMVVAAQSFLVDKKSRYKAGKSTILGS